MIFTKALELESNKKNFVMITLLKVVASAPQEEGAKCIVSIDGLEEGTIGGGKIEAHAISYAQKMLSNVNSKRVETNKWNLQTDIGMTCGGVVELLFEKFSFDQWQIAIFGAGHVSQALTKILATLDCRVVVIDDREDWLNKLPQVIKLNTRDHKFAVSQFNDKTFFICMTKGHASDVPFLVEIYNQFPDASYIGVIGSKSKRNAIVRDLKAQGVDDKFINKLQIPIGLALGNNTPNEISISIAAQLLEVRG